MSYILDALKKAESERALGSVPDLHAQPVPLVALDGKGPLWRRPLILFAAGLTVLLAAFAWMAPWRAAPVAVVTPQSAVTQSPPINLPPVIQPPLAAAPSIAVEPGPAANIPAPVAEPIKPKTPPAKPPAKAHEKAPAVVAVPVQPPPAKMIERPPEPAVAEVPVPMLRELPANIQREIPAVTIGGYIYASKPSERSVLINNRLIREGDSIASGLTLERMMPREAVLNYRGYRYRIPY